MASKIFKKVYLNDYFTVVGPLEKESHLKSLDLTMNDYYYGCKTFEQAEIKMQRVAIDNLLNNNSLFSNNIDVIVGGDLSNQIAITSYAIKNYNIPFLGIYSACATFTESLIILGSLIESGMIKKGISSISSHNLTAEKQFRYPVEYGAVKPHTSTFTTTGSVASLVSNKETNIKVESVTVGTIIDMNIKDANHLGAVMAPGAAEVIYKHLKDLNRSYNYYDLILTGDLGCIGSKIMLDYLKNTNNIVLKNHKDAGCLLYLESQDTYAGGSGPACLPIVLYNMILKNKKYKKILIVATGALHSPTMVNQKMSIPGIAHAVSLEVL